MQGRTQSVYYRDERGRQPVRDFIDALPMRREKKVEVQIEEYLNGQPAKAPPPGFPVSSQIDGELRELRIRFGGTQYRILYQRSRNLVVLLHAFEKKATTRGGRRRAMNLFIDFDKLAPMSDDWVSPIGQTVTEVSEEKARQSQEYREIGEEYAAIKELRKRNWIAAHIRERRYELELTQKEVAEKAGTSHSFISKVEGGDHLPTLAVLKRILAVLDEELLIGIERVETDGDPERVVARVPEIGAELTV